MLRLAPNISMLYADRPFLERIDAAARAGFACVECQFPYEHAPAVLAARLRDAGIEMVGINTPPGDFARGERGLAGVPGREAAFDRQFDEALRYAAALGRPHIHVMAGVVPPAERAAGREVFAANLRRAAARAGAEGIGLVLEAINRRDMPGYLVSRSDEMAELIAAIAAPNVRLMFDVYHVQISEGDLIRRLEARAPILGHVQVAAVPSRAEPDEGEVAYGAIFQALAAIGYRGAVGLEYRPRADTDAGLGWIERLGLGRGGDRRLA